jgi:hypothetical protein
VAYFGPLGRFPDLVDCPALNDKIQWLKVFDKDRDMIDCVLAFAALA